MPHDEGHMIMSVSCLSGISQEIRTISCAEGDFFQDGITSWGKVKMNKVAWWRSEPVRKHKCFVMVWGIYVFSMICVTALWSWALIHGRIVFVLQLGRLEKRATASRTTEDVPLKPSSQFSQSVLLKESDYPHLWAATSELLTPQLLLLTGKLRRGAKNVSAGTRLNAAFCLSQRHKGNRTRVNKMI